MKNVFTRYFCEKTSGYHWVTRQNSVKRLESRSKKYLTRTWFYKWNYYKWKLSDICIGTYGFTNSLVDESATWGLDNLSLVGRGVVRQSSSVSESLNHCWKQLFESSALQKVWKPNYFKVQVELYQRSLGSLKSNNIKNLMGWILTQNFWPKIFQIKSPSSEHSTSTQK